MQESSGPRLYDEPNFIINITFNNQKMLGQ